MIYVPIVMALLGLAFMAIKRSWVLKQDAGDGKMKEISDYITFFTAFTTSAALGNHSFNNVGE